MSKNTSPADGAGTDPQSVDAAVTSASTKPRISVIGPNTGCPNCPASTPTVPSSRYSTDSRRAARRSTSASAGRSEKLTDSSSGTTDCCPAPSGNPRGKAAAAARVESEATRASSSVHRASWNGSVNSANARAPRSRARAAAARSPPAARTRPST